MESTHHDTSSHVKRSSPSGRTSHRQFDEFTGVYSNHAFGDVTVTQDDDGLLLLMYGADNHTYVVALPRPVCGLFLMNMQLYFCRYSTVLKPCLSCSREPQSAHIMYVHTH